MMVLCILHVDNVKRIYSSAKCIKELSLAAVARCLDLVLTFKRQALSNSLSGDEWHSFLSCSFLHANHFEYMQKFLGTRWVGPGGANQPAKIRHEDHAFEKGNDDISISLVCAPSRSDLKSTTTTLLDDTSWRAPASPHGKATILYAPRWRGLMC